MVTGSLANQHVCGFSNDLKITALRVQCGVVMGITDACAAKLGNRQRRSHASVRRLQGLPYALETRRFRHSDPAATQGRVREAAIDYLPVSKILNRKVRIFRRTAPSEGASRRSRDSRRGRDGGFFKSLSYDLPNVSSKSPLVCSIMHILCDKTESKFEPCTQSAKRPIALSSFVTTAHIRSVSTHSMRASAVAARKQREQCRITPARSTV